ncbi:MAG: SH3 domain-containing protein [Selenomonadaceae bacterium]|nr:SH3 domain-containing protein [Selenomonadaceae bacterium]MBR1859067.1 SH3 domain-containing protein [Selenomonadaceae bacterium]
MVKRIAMMMVLAAVLVLAGAQSSVAEAGDYSGGRVVNIRTYLSIRAYPTTHSTELVRVPNGTYLEIYHREGDFYYVYVPYCKIWGYAHRSYVSFY